MLRSLVSRNSTLAIACARRAMSSVPETMKVSCLYARPLLTVRVMVTPPKVLWNTKEVSRRRRRRRETRQIRVSHHTFSSTVSSIV